MTSSYSVGSSLVVVDGVRETLKGAGEQVRVGTMGSVGSNLLVIEKRDETNVGVVGQGLAVVQAADQSLNGAVRHHQVVQTSREDELVVGTSDGGRLSVEEAELKVENLLLYRL